MALIYFMGKILAKQQNIVYICKNCKTAQLMENYGKIGKEQQTL